MCWSPEAGRVLEGMEVKVTLVGLSFMLFTEKLFNAGDAVEGLRDAMLSNAA